MTLTVGSTLGPYEITALIGAGGMGEVYRARDKRLDRTVAIKVLPAALSARADLRQRLEREARTISSLNHAHICTLFDIGETSDGSAYLVMEHLEGETLAERLTRGSLPLRQALRIGVEIAEALDRAHRQQIVHRDLKPGNVMLTKSGVKLLDFGLAKLIAGAEQAALGNDAPTMAAVTEEGMIVGTLHYMAPEQLEGKNADARADIFALGATLYEMLSGHRAFEATSRAGVIARILHEEPPPLASVAPNVPPPVVRLVEHCLMKDPDDRWQTARDVAIQLRGLADGPSGSTEAMRAAAPEPAARDWRRPALTVLLVVLGAAAALAWQRWRGNDDAAPSAFTHVSIVPPAGTRVALYEYSGLVAVAPDGSKMAMALLRDDGVMQLFLRRLDSFETTPIAGTERASSAFFSPDGNQLAFISDGNLKRVTINGGTPETICGAGPSTGGSWGSDGNIVFNPIPGAAPHRVPANGGTPERLAGLAADDTAYGLTYYRPELGFVLFVTEVDGQPYDEAEIRAYSLKTRETKVVARGTAPRFVDRTGDLLFARGGKLWKVPFDPKTLATEGTPAPILEPVLTEPGSGSTVYDVTADGAIVYLPGTAEDLRKRLVLVDRNGKKEALPFPPNFYEGARVSDDGRLLSVEVVGSNNDVWLGDLARGTLNRLTTSHENLAPILSADGRFVAVSRFRSDLPSVHLLRTDGGAEPERLTKSDRPRFPYSFSRDGSTLAYIEYVGSSLDVGVLRVRPRPEVALRVESRFSETHPALSPDGRWLAYASNETGRFEIYIRSTGSDPTRLRVSTDGGEEPLWSHGGDELFYRQVDSIMSVRVRFTGGLTATHPLKLFDVFAGRDDVRRCYDVLPGDQKFVVVERPQIEPTRSVNIVTNALQ